MSIDVATVEKVFERLLAVYGEAFMRKWGAVPMSNVKTAWAHELQSTNVRAVNWALDNLPEDAPNAVQFRNLCRAAPKPEELALPAPFDLEATRRGAKKLASLRFANSGRDWAMRLLQRTGADGVRLSITQRDMMREALPHVSDEHAEGTR